MVVDPKVIIQLFNEYLKADSKKVTSFESYVESKKGTKEPYFKAYPKTGAGVEPSGYINLSLLAKTEEGSDDDIINKKYAELLVYLAKDPPLNSKRVPWGLTDYVKPLLQALITKEAYLNIKVVDKSVIAAESKKEENKFATFISTEDKKSLDTLLTTAGTGMLRPNEKIRKTKFWGKFWTIFRKYILPPVLVGGAATTAGWLVTKFVQAGETIFFTGSVAGTALTFGAIGVAATLGVIGVVKAAKAFTRLYYKNKYGRSAKKNFTLLNELNEFDTAHITNYDEFVKAAGNLPIVKLMETIRKKDELILKRKGPFKGIRNAWTRTFNRNRLHELMRFKKKIAQIDSGDTDYAKFEVLNAQIDSFLLANMENYFKQTRRTRNKQKFQNADIEAKHMKGSRKLPDVREYINKRLAEIASLHVFGAQADPTLIVKAADMTMVQKTEGKSTKAETKKTKKGEKKTEAKKYTVNGTDLYVKDKKIYTDKECTTEATGYNLNKKDKPVKVKAEETEIDKILKEIDIIIAFKEKNEKEISKMTNSERIDYYDKLIAAKRKLLQQALLSGKFDGEDKKLVLATFQKSVEDEIADLEKKRGEAAAKLDAEELIEVRTKKLGWVKKVEFKFNKATGKVESVITAGYTSAKLNGKDGWMSKDGEYFIDKDGNVEKVADEHQNGVRTITVAGSKREIKFKYKTDDGSIVSITTPGFTAETYAGVEGWVSEDGRVFISNDAKAQIIPLKMVTADDGATLYLNEKTKDLYTDVDGTKPAKEYFLDGTNVLAIWEVKIIKGEAEKAAYNRKTKKFYKEDKKTLLTDIELSGTDFVRKVISALLEKPFGKGKVYVDPTSKKVYSDDKGTTELADVFYDGKKVMAIWTEYSIDGSTEKVYKNNKDSKFYKADKTTLFDMTKYDVDEATKTIKAKVVATARKKISVGADGYVWVDKTAKKVYTTQKGSKESDKYFWNDTAVVAIWVEYTVDGTGEKVYKSNKDSKFYKADKTTPFDMAKYVADETSKTIKVKTSTKKAEREEITADDGKKVYVDKKTGKVYLTKVSGKPVINYKYDAVSGKVTKVVEIKTETKEDTVKVDGVDVKVEVEITTTDGVETKRVITKVLTAGYKLDKGVVVKEPKKAKKPVVKTETKEDTVKVDGVDVKVEVEITTTDGVETKRVITKVLTAGYKLNTKGEVEKVAKKAKSTLKKLPADDKTWTWVDVDKKIVYLDEEGKTETKDYLYTGTKVVFYMQEVKVEGETTIVYLNLKDKLLYMDKTGSTLARDFVFDAVNHKATRIAKDDTKDLKEEVVDGVKLYVNYTTNIIYLEDKTTVATGYIIVDGKVEKKPVKKAPKKAIERNEISLPKVYEIKGAKLDLNTAEVLLENKRVYYFNPKTGELQKGKPKNLIVPLTESDVNTAVEKYKARKKADDEDSHKV